MERLKPYLEKVSSRGVDNLKIIDPSKVVTGLWVRLKCEFGCPRYRRNLCCPPYTPTPDYMRRILDSYNAAILLHRRRKENGYDAYFNFVNEFNEIVVDLEITLFLEGYYKAWGMGSASCKRCKECDPSNICSNPYRARPSMEACGIDVFRTAQDNGFNIGVVRTHDEEVNIFGLVLAE